MNRRPTPLQVARRLYQNLRSYGPRKLTIMRGLAVRSSAARTPARQQAFYEQVIGILFLRGMARWKGAKRGRMIAPA